jgi:DNA-binding PadR family transcriptional regulator
MPDALKPADFHILMALAQGPRHGYALMKEVESESRGCVRLEIGSLYRLLARLLDSGLIEEANEDDRRRYYRISRLGLRTLKGEAQRLEGLVELSRARKLLPEAGA